MTVEDLQGVLLEYIAVKVAEMKANIFETPDALAAVCFEEFERLKMANYSGIKAIDHTTFRELLRELTKKGVINITDLVATTPQTLTDQQKLQARLNIGAEQDLSVYATIVSTDKKLTYKAGVMNLTSITTAPENPTLQDKYYNVAEKTIYTYEDYWGTHMWVYPHPPVAGTVYVFGDSNYLWDGSKLYEPSAEQDLSVYATIVSTDKLISDLSLGTAATKNTDDFIQIPIEITAYELLLLKLNSQLIPSQNYKITDYNSLIVRAIGYNSLEWLDGFFDIVVLGEYDFEYIATIAGYSTCEVTANIGGKMGVNIDQDKSAFLIKNGVVYTSIDGVISEIASRAGNCTLLVPHNSTYIDISGCVYTGKLETDFSSLVYCPNIAITSIIARFSININCSFSPITSIIAPNITKLDAYGSSLTATSIASLLRAMVIRNTFNGERYFAVSGGTNAGISTWSEQALADKDTLIGLGYTFLYNE